MSKTVCKEDTIVLGGHDISEWVSRWALIGEVGELHLAEIDIVTDDPDTPLKISGMTLTQQVGSRGMTGYNEVSQAVTGARLTINGTDISDHVSGWREIVDVGRPRKVRLILQDDPEVLTITPLRGPK